MSALVGTLFLGKSPLKGKTTFAKLRSLSEDAKRRLADFELPSTSIQEQIRVLGSLSRRVAPYLVR